METNRIVFCPVYINVQFPHWCGIIFDFERHIERFSKEVEKVFERCFAPIMTCKMEIRTFTGWLQRDGYSGGVLTVQLFELYLSVARTIPPDQSFPMARGDRFDAKQLEYERYKLFSYVIDSIAT
ncbi:hypothetical protein JG688_00016420 [Phytophthora aleatoria]|uniref:Ubiquitin-like protease family profile domain-containing protein n=1 Tax=Phytophthora aleatoria TaxID=2496075 RepID=A0A8J5ICF0_9STRA|nr:hypothetical protein JG688_00016420 [Phytophthora aleatoria]